VLLFDVDAPPAEEEAEQETKADSDISDSSDSDSEGDATSSGKRKQKKSRKKTGTPSAPSSTSVDDDIAKEIAAKYGMLSDMDSDSSDVDSDDSDGSAMSEVVGAGEPTRASATAGAADSDDDDDDDDMGPVRSRKERERMKRKAEKLRKRKARRLAKAEARRQAKARQQEAVRQARGETGDKALAITRVKSNWNIAEYMPEVVANLFGFVAGAFLAKPVDMRNELQRERESERSHKLGSQITASQAVTGGGPARVGHREEDTKAEEEYIKHLVSEYFTQRMMKRHIPEINVRCVLFCFCFLLLFFCAVERLSPCSIRRCGCDALCGCVSLGLCVDLAWVCFSVRARADMCACVCVCVGVLRDSFLFFVCSATCSHPTIFRCYRAHTTP